MRFCVIALGLMFVTGACFAQSAGPTIYKFVEMSYSDEHHPPTDPDAFYYFTLGQAESPWRISSGMRYKEVQKLMKYYHISSVQELLGRTFTSDQPFNIAMNLMEVQADHDSKYVPPTKEELYQRAVQSLAHLECPSFDDVDNNTTLRAFQIDWGAGDAFFSKLKDDVARASGGKILLSEDGAENHQLTCKCMGTKNARITDGISKMEFFFAPGVTDPFFCEKKTLALDPNTIVGESKSTDRGVTETSAPKSATTTVLNNDNDKQNHGDAGEGR